MDDDHPLAQRLDIRHIVAGQQDGRARAAVVFGDELADAALHGHIQTDGGFVEEQDFGPVQQRPDDLHFHPFAQRKVADRLFYQVFQVEQLDELVTGLR